MNAALRADATANSTSQGLSAACGANASRPQVPSTTGHVPPRLRPTGCTSLCWCCTVRMPCGCLRTTTAGARWPAACLLPDAARPTPHGELPAACRGARPLELAHGPVSLRRLLSNSLPTLLPQVHPATPALPDDGRQRRALAGPCGRAARSHAVCACGAAPRRRGRRKRDYRRRRRSRRFRLAAAGSDELLQRRERPQCGRGGGAGGTRPGGG